MASRKKKTAKAKTRKRAKPKPRARAKVRAKPVARKKTKIKAKATTKAKAKAGVRRKPAARRRSKRAPAGVARAAGEFSLVASAFSRDGRWLATSSEGKVHVWDLAPVRRGEHAALVLRVTEVGVPDRIALSPDGARLAVASHGHPEVRVYDTTKGSLAWTASLHAVTAIAFAPDGGRLVVGDVLIEELLRRGFAVVLDAGTGVPLWRSPAVDRPLRDVAFHSDGLLVIAVLGPDGVAVVWDAERGNELFRFPARLTPKEVSERIGCASAITADGQRVAFAFDGRAEVWRVDSAERTAAIDVGGRTRSIALARDGTLLVTGSPVAARWTLPHGARAGPVGGDGRVSLSPDGDLLLAASSYTELRGPKLEPARR
ncbi:MAG: WD40 repeat domain-containing protein [Deltaproteobacteria bacterium]|nr:WD40 repeat domain-containing protein [Deltaproteobacteria bacterium]